jgi:WD40 repeat protein
MTLAPGTKLGPYEILERIGAGGMGEVYRARDPRVGRDIAIKVSSEQFSDRFAREVHAVAALNHSNVCTLYDVGPNYLVMELVEGPTLADRIKQGPIPIEESLEIARQIADALEAAHEKGIIHRDLKPGNIKLRPDGTVKVLDFGLAKVEEAASISLETSPTLSVAQTAAGMILGTVAYMSPEQARGKPVDKRADIWAFGVILYEMLTGTQLFSGETVSDTLAATLTKDPDLEQVPAKVRPLLRRCLEKDSRKRLRDIGDAMPLLEGNAVAAPVKTAWTALIWPGVALALLTALGVALWVPWSAEKPAERPLIRLDVSLGSDVSLPNLTSGKNTVIISPDGTRLVYASGNPARLFAKKLDQPTAAELPGTTGATAAFFSPDGQWIGFPAGNRLNKISVEGGAVVPLGEVFAQGFSGADWSEDGNIYFGQIGRGLTRISSNGGPPMAVTELGNGETAHAHPQILPGGKAVLFSCQRSPASADTAVVEVLILADHRRKSLVRGGTSARYLATSKNCGYLIYTNKATLFAVPFDPDRLEKLGMEVPLINDVAYAITGNLADYCVSDSGAFIYRKSGAGPDSESGVFQWLDAFGRKESLWNRSGSYSFPRFSPDGKRLAFSLVGRERTDICVYDIKREVMTRLTSAAGPYYLPVWTPDGRFIIFGAPGGLFWTRADGAGQPQLLMESNNVLLIPWSISNDGRVLAYDMLSESNLRQIWVMSLEEQNGQLKAGKPEPYLKSQFNDMFAAFSPDGHWLAYQSDDSGRKEVWVRPYPSPASGQGGKWQVSNNGGMQPAWSPNRHELLYRSGDQIISVEYKAKGDAFEAERPKVWISKLGGTVWQLAPDGKRVVVVTPLELSGTPKQDHEAVLLLNFFDELRRRVPIGAK